MEEFFMKEALKLAMSAFEEDEIPVGAVVVKDNEIIGRGYNQKDIEIYGGVLEQECLEILQKFFKNKRNK